MPAVSVNNTFLQTLGDREDSGIKITYCKVIDLLPLTDLLADVSTQLDNFRTNKRFG